MRRCQLLGSQRANPNFKVIILASASNPSGMKRQESNYKHFGKYWKHVEKVYAHNGNGDKMLQVCSSRWSAASLGSSTRCTLSLPGRKRSGAQRFRPVLQQTHRGSLLEQTQPRRWRPSVTQICSVNRAESEMCFILVPAIDILNDVDTVFWILELTV